MRITLLAVVGASLAFGACSSADKPAAPDKGPNSSVSDPGPNSTAPDPGPNPTVNGIETLSGEFTVVGGSCARLVLDAKTATLELVVPKGYTVTADGLRLDNKLVAPLNARIFLTGRRTDRQGKCGRITNVENVVSVRA